MSKYFLKDLDIFYLSYDEPNAQIFFDDLCKKSFKKPIHIHGIKGFDSVHKKAAMLSNTKRFITIDGDNIVRPELFDQYIDDLNNEDAVYSFKSKNITNGLEYGNGGVKVWPKKQVLTINTHENANDKISGTDFCWTYKYYRIDTICSDVYHAQSPLHAFRAGYRETVKMSLIGGEKLKTWNDMVKEIVPINWSCMMIWTCIGSDKENGWWTIYGARQGLYDLWCDDLDYNNIRDYDWFNEKFEIYKNDDPKLKSIELGAYLKSNLNLYLPILENQESSWFKNVFISPPRDGLLIHPNMKC